MGGREGRKGGGDIGGEMAMRGREGKTREGEGGGECAIFGRMEYR